MRCFAVDAFPDVSSPGFYKSGVLYPGFWFIAVHYCSCVCVRDFGSYWLVGWFLRPAVGVFWVTHVVAVKTVFYLD